MVKNKPLRILLMILGLLFTAVGAIGIVLPVLPTTPFVLLAGFLFSFSSERLGNWLERNKTFAPYLRHWKDGSGIPRAVKIRVLVMLWIGLVITFFLLSEIKLILMLSIIGSLVTIHIVTIKPKGLEQTKNAC
ncbi:MAG: YbaN family protein [Sphaerochaeta sp.]|nr:YbaN family protein [Sphaerochaeta sp.]